jgi:hypothetical protein
MGVKIEAIRRALFHKGIPITDGIPEEIIKELHESGYKITRRKKFDRTTQSAVEEK